MKSFLSILRKYSVAMVMNLIGLVLGFTAFIVLMVQVSYQCDFDKNYPTSGRIYRVDKAGATNDDIFRNILPRGYADDIISSSPHIEAGSISCPFIGSIIFNVADENGRMTEPFKSKVNVVYPELFKIFGVEFIEGNADALIDQQTVAIPQSLAKRLFANESAIGNILTHNEQYIFGSDRGNSLVIGAVYKDFPENSQMDNDIYLNVGNIQKGSYGGANFNCYLLLDSPDNKELVEKTFNDTFNYESDWLTDIKLTPVENIYFADAGSAVYKNGNRSQMWMLICIAIIVLLIGGINYATFFTALAPMRVKSINTRKILGSSVIALRSGLVFEAVFFSLAALAIALCIISPVSNALYAEGIADMPFRFSEQTVLVIIAALTALLTGLFAGIFPSIYVTSLPPAFALKGDMAYSLSGKRFRTVMMALQYTLSFVLLVFVIALYRQNEFLISRNNGFEKDKVAVVQISQTHYAQKADWIREKLSSLDEVVDVAYAMECMGGSDSYSTSTFNYNGKEIRTFVFMCSPNFLSVMGIPIEEGRNFSESDDNGSCVIINKAAADQGIDMLDGGALDGIEIIGRTGEVCINSLRQDISPICYIAVSKDFASLTCAHIRLADGFDRSACVKKINEVLREMDPNYLFETKLYDDILGELYEPEIKQEKSIALFSLLAALLTLVGIFGQVLLDLQYSKRTIAIRKVYGADNGPLVKENLMKYAVLLGVAFIAAVPIAWMLINGWQQNFVEKVGISGVEFIVAFVVIAALTAAIVSLMSWRAISSNPVDTLRKE